MGQSQQPAKSKYGEDHQPAAKTGTGGLWDTVTGATSGMTEWMGGADLRHLSKLSPIEKARKMREALTTLEDQLAHPLVVSSVGRAYRQVHTVAEALVGDAYHKGDPTERPTEDLLSWDPTPEVQEILALLEEEDMYPSWRREALEAAYTLFFEDIASSGNAQYLSQLPEPPVGKTVPLHQATRATGQKDVSCVYQSGSRMWRCTVWEYGIRKTQGVYVPGASEVFGHADGGREIVLKNRSTRYCACAGGSWIARACSPSADEQGGRPNAMRRPPPDVNYLSSSVGSAIPAHEDRRRVRSQQRTLPKPDGDTSSPASWNPRPVTIEQQSSGYGYR